MKGKILAGLMAAAGLLLGSVSAHATDEAKSGSSDSTSKSSCALQETKTEALNGTVTGSTYDHLNIQSSNANQQQFSVLVTDDTAFLQDGQKVHGSSIKAGDEVRAALVPIGENQFFALAVNVEKKGATDQGQKTEGKKAPSKSSKEKKKAAPKTGGASDESNPNPGYDNP